MAKAKVKKSRVSKKISPEVIESMSITPPIEEKGQPKYLNLSKTQLMIGGAMIVLALIVYFAKGVFVAAIVNGQMIPRLAVVKELEKSYGKQALDQLVTKALVSQEAAKQKIVIDRASIDAELAKLEENLKAQGQTLDSALELQGMTRTDLEEQIRIQKEIEALLADKVAVTDQEVTDYIASNRDYLTENATEDELASEAAAQVKQQKLAKEFQTWMEELRTNAKINYLMKY